MDKKTVGIIGGMGPLATADLFKKIVLNTKAAKDQEHLKVLIDNNTDIPDRTAAILYGKESPIPELQKSAKLLESMGADLLVMPCNTAHYFYKDVAASVNIPLLNMLELTRDSLLARGVKKAGLLATSGTIESGIYQRTFENSGIELLTPSEYQQDAVMDLIYKGVKAGKSDFDVKDVKTVMDDIISRGAEVLILGCTELPVAVEMYNLTYPVCDPTTELARGAITRANGECV